MLVHLRAEELGVPLFVGRVEHRLQPVRRGLVGPEDAEVVGVEPNHLGEPRSQHPRRLGGRRTRRRHVDAEVPELRQPQIFEQQAAVGVGVVAHPQLALRRQRRDLRVESAVCIEQFVGAVGRQPVGEHLHVFGGIAGACQRDLVGAPRPCCLLAVDVVRAGPTLRRAENDHRPSWASLVARCGIGFDLGDFAEHQIDQRREPPMRICGIVVARRLRRSTGCGRSRPSGCAVRPAESGPAQWDWRSCSR